MPSSTSVPSSDAANGPQPRVLMLAAGTDGHVGRMVDVLGGAGYVVDIRDHADGGRLPPGAEEFDVVVLDPRTLALAPVPATQLDDVQVGRLRIDAQRRMVYVDDIAVRMSARELCLLHHLAAHPDVVFSRSALLSAVWGSTGRTEGSVTEYVRRLRILLAPTGIGECIVTRKGFGYALDSAALR